MQLYALKSCQYTQLQHFTLEKNLTSLKILHPPGNLLTQALKGCESDFEVNNFSKCKNCYKWSNYLVLNNAYVAVLGQRLKSITPKTNNLTDTIFDDNNRDETETKKLGCGLKTEIKTQI